MDDQARAEFEANWQRMEAYEQEFAAYNQKRKARLKKYFRFYHRLEVLGLEHVPDGPALIVANHGGCFDLDIVALMDCAHPRRTIHALIAENWHYLNTRWGKYWIGGGIPLWTRGGTRYEYLDPYLQPGGSRYPALVAIYPEGDSGTFQNRHALRRFFAGAVRIALRYRVPIVPAAQVGFQRAAPIVKEIERDHAPSEPILFLPFTLPTKLKIEFGPAFTLEKYYGRELSRAEENWVANQFIRPRLAAVLAKHAPVKMAEVRAEMKGPI